MKTVIALILICFALPAAAETWKDKEIRERKELELQLRQSRQQQSGSPYSAQSNAECMGGCGSDHGICVSNCSSGYGYSNQHGQCVARCDVAQSRCMSRCR